MRFLLKTAFWLGLIAFFLPSSAPEDAERPGVNYFGAFLGAQEAISDMGGFCERAPAACAAGRDVGAFAAARVGDGIAYAYNAAMGTPPATPPAAITAVDGPREARPSVPSVAQPDPIQTAAVAAAQVRRAAGLPPFGMPRIDEASSSAASPRPIALVPAAPLAAGPASPAIPTPAPRA